MELKYVRDGMRYIPIAQNIIQNRDETEKISDEKEVEIESVKDQSIAPLSYFGYQIFQGDPSIFQSSTFGSVDPNYNIGPGDEIIVMLWGESQFRESFIVDREGYVFIPDVGQVFVNGLILEDLEKKIFLILSKVYSTLNPINGKPTSFMDISLGNLRPLRIIVLGEVNQPGAYSVSPSSSLSSSLYYFRGPTTAGSLRDIRLIRGGNTIASIDFYQYLLSGYNPNDIRLQLDDIVFIPPRVKTISIRGQIKRPGIYELKDNEGLKDLIDIAGNLNITAYLKRAQISRKGAPRIAI
jgi:Periplasmic protein involved in polysaccharide export